MSWTYLPSEALKPVVWHLSADADELQLTCRQELKLETIVAAFDSC